MLTVYRWHIMSENKKLDSGDPAQIAQVVKRGVTEEMVRRSRPVARVLSAPADSDLTTVPAHAAGRPRLALRDVLRFVLLYYNSRAEFLGEGCEEREDLLLSCITLIITCHLLSLPCPSCAASD